MKGAIESMLGIIIICLMVCLATAFMTASINTRVAQNFFDAAVTEIEASDFADNVIDDLKTNATNNGFSELSVDLIEVNGRKCAEVKLIYNYTFPLLNSMMSHEIKGYAR